MFFNMQSNIVLILSEFNFPSHNLIEIEKIEFLFKRAKNSADDAKHIKWVRSVEKNQSTLHWRWVKWMEQWRSLVCDCQRPNRTFTAYRWWRNSHQILAFWSIAHIYKQRDMYVVTMCCRHKPLIIIHVKSSFQNCLEHANKTLARPTLLNANSLKEYFGGAKKSISMKFSRHPFQSTENRWNNIQFWCNETDWVFKVDWKKKKIIQPCLVITLDY